MNQLVGFVVVPGFERYLIDRTGRVYSGLRGGRFLKPWSLAGYPAVSLMATGASKATKVHVHRLVATTFLPNVENLPTVNHVNGVKTDSRVDSLEWSSYAANNRHALDIGLTQSFGERHYASRLKVSDVRAIRLLARAGAFHREIAAQFGVGRKHVTKIVSGKVWRRAA